MWGGLAHSRDRRPVYLLGVGVMTVISPIFAITGILPVIISLCLVQGVGFSASSTGAATVAADLVPASRPLIQGGMELLNPLHLLSF